MNSVTSVAQVRAVEQCTCWGPLLACWRTRGLSADQVPTGSAPSGCPSSGRLARLARKCRSRQLSTPLRVAMCSSVHTSPVPAVADRGRGLDGIIKSIQQVWSVPKTLAPGAGKQKQVRTRYK